MQLLRLGEPGSERPFVRAGDGTLRDLSALTADIDGGFFAGDGVARVAAALAAGELPEAGPEAARARVGAPIARPGKVVCIGLNYRQHAEESGAEVPAEPVVFMKAPDVVVGPQDDVLVPRGSTKTDWEVELGVVIGKTARYLESAEEALEYVAGYTVSNDVSEREFQLERGGTWDKGKSCENFNPLGPWLVTADEVPDPQDLGLRLWVNGEKKQDSSTKDMIFSVAEIVHYVSQYMVLRPGDLINTGTPQGVALGQPDPKPYLREGDVIELEIDGLGRQRQNVRQA
ncbi:fumarylacetoacetate hydrolase family protein [Amycolatopsis roodepoortensis]|uniref:2-keto-4-pentenoate hydratase/2-oxohepta-3-ene-1,7-dioic acid hydratase in catechol pathway n=1 Tax=Amycolatopsis roodepoortensis TaxID=700274 RepID=A0ABR9L325_9PSEU|nr:fumarylacetoacetate hydrolase family protein [Amycolatopsis roodepoortensis]MBE1575159.1 2-keto-4-pentenoate hydratase/2-oxohepta-3-ene-1,7-dioic acid hydratase in catechol pathway [Amycolatopsis roodepoortensis]